MHVNIFIHLEIRFATSRKKVYSIEGWRTESKTVNCTKVLAHFLTCSTTLKHLSTISVVREGVSKRAYEKPEEGLAPMSTVAFDLPH